MGGRTNEADIAAVTETVRAYYDGSMEGDEAKLSQVFHPRACIVGNEHGELVWATLDQYVAECKQIVAEAGPYEWQIDGLSFEGDTALVRVGSQYAGVWYSDDLSMLRIDDAWRIVHKTYYAHPTT
jgi:ketosteroid isomerase-like protein